MYDVGLISRNGEGGGGGGMVVQQRMIFVVDNGIPQV